MRDKKLQVFVSSTYTDLKEERQAAVEAILSSGNIPAGMELFAAGDESQMTVIKRWIDESDVYLLILGGRYGSVEKNSGKSYTHLEYKYALEQKKPLFAVVINKDALNEKVKVMGVDAMEQKNSKLLNEFRDLVLSNISKFWNDKKDIQLAIYGTLADFEHTKDLVGWVRGDKAVNAIPLAEEIAALSKENAELRTKANQATTVTYSGLTFEELKRLLEDEKIQDSALATNLFEYLIIDAEKFGQGRVEGALNVHIAKELARLKILQVDMLGVGRFYKFTEDGHNFYLKALTSSRK